MESLGGRAAPLSAPAAFSDFYAETLPHVYGYFIHRCGGSRAVAEDLTQEKFMSAVRQIKGQGTRPDSPIAWVLGIARHKLIDHYRRQAREQRRLEAVAGEASVDEWIEWDDNASRERAVAALGDVAELQRAALVLRYMDGLSVPEVARSLGKSVHATESLLARGRARFKQAYEEVAL